MGRGALQVATFLHTVNRVTAGDRGGHDSISVAVGPRRDQHARRHVQEVALYRGGRGVSVLDVHLEATQERGDLAIETADDAVHHRRHCLVGAALVHGGVHVDTDAPLAGDCLGRRVWVEYLARPSVQVHEVDLATAVGDGHVVQVVVLLALVSVSGQRMRGAARVAVRVAAARHDVPHPRHGVTGARAEAGDEAPHGRVAVLLPARDRVALDVALGVPVAHPVGVGGEPLWDGDVILAPDRAVAGSRELTRVCGLQAVGECELVPCYCALDHASDRLGVGIGALSSALLADLVVARHVPGGDVGPALGLSHRPVLEHEVAEHP